MIYYPLSVLMLADIKDILIITTPRDQLAFQELLGDGEQWGIHLSYEVQHRPGGLAEALVIGERFLAESPCCLILGDNIFYGDRLGHYLREVGEQREGATIFGYWVKEPERYGVAHFDEHGNLIAIDEKPINPPSNYAITGIYFFDEQAPELARSLKPSPRGELEITDLNNLYLEKGQLRLEKMGRGTAWLDTGTHESLMQAGNFIETIELRQGLKVCCPEEIAYLNDWISKGQLLDLAERLKQNSYGQYLIELTTRNY